MFTQMVCPPTMWPVQTHTHAESMCPFLTQHTITYTYLSIHSCAQCTHTCRCVRSAHNHTHAAHTLTDGPSFANSTQSRACFTHKHTQSYGHSTCPDAQKACTLSCTHIVPTIQHSYLWVHDTNTHTASYNSSHTHAHSTSIHVCTTHIHTVRSCEHLNSTHTLTYTSHTLMCAHAAHGAAG